MINPKQNIAL